jgi:hypothetical protein
MWECNLIIGRGAEKMEDGVVVKEILVVRVDER